MSGKKMLSVIVPVYQAEQYLERCVKSILGCSFKNIELILVDDESPDKSPEMCDYFATMDERVKVVHQKNAGGGYARNTGIEIAQGEYIAFCDNDDMVPMDAYEIMMKKATETNADMIRGIVRRTYVDTGETRLWIRKPEDPLYSAVLGLLGGIYKKSFLMENSLRFTNLNMGPDVLFMAQAITSAKSIEYVDEITYEYIMRESASEITSAMQKANTVFSYYYDDFVWRDYLIKYICGNTSLMEKYEKQLSGFCKTIDENWFHFSEVEQEKCFEVLKNIINSIRWECQSQNPKGYIQMSLKQFSKMDAKKYTRKLKREILVLRPIKHKIKAILFRSDRNIP